MNPGYPSGKMEREVFDMSKLREKISALEEDSENSCCEGTQHTCGLPLPVKRRLFALDKLHGKRLSIEAQFRREVMQLERKYHSFFEPLNKRRAAIVSGASDPLPEELEGFEDSGVEEVQENEAPGDLPLGIPSFWLTCLLRHPDIESIITEKDAKALEHLQDIRYDYLDDSQGFKLEFYFSPNEYFSNEVLCKEYHIAEAENGTPIYLHAVGTPIDWKAGKNLCFKTLVRTQRHRSNNTMRTVKREEKTESFFHFFNPPVGPHEEDEGEEEEAKELEEQAQFDYELGELFKDQIIPNALGWFTGLALEDWESENDEEEDEDYEDYEEEGDDDDDEEEEGEEEEDDDDDGKGNVVASGRPTNPMERQVNRKGSSTEKPECKQQ